MLGFWEAHSLGDDLIGPAFVGRINQPLREEMLDGIEPCGLVDGLWVIKDDLEYWSLENYDYVGSPECILSHYDLSPFPPFSELKFFAPVVLQGLNGGLSLRNPKAFIKVISEYIALTSAFQSYAGGVGEDIFFSVLGRVSKEFKIPNEVTASEFALTGDFSGWSKFNNGKFPMGFHRWYTNEADKSHVLGILAKLSSLAS